MTALKRRILRLERQLKPGELLDLRELGIDQPVPAGFLRQVLKEIDGSDCGVGPSRSRRQSKSGAPVQSKPEEHDRH